MYIFEEYQRRHSLEYPIIRRPPSKCYLMVRPKNGEKELRVFNIYVDTEPHKPAFFRFAWLKRGHNTYRNQPNGSKTLFLLRRLSEEAEDKRVEWDDFEVEILKLVGSIAKLYDPISDLVEARLLAWNMFLLSVDERLRNLSIKCQRFLCASIDPELSIEDRFKAQQAVVDGMSNSHDSYLSTRWDKMSVICEPTFYATWMAELITRAADMPEFVVQYSDRQDVA